MSLRDLLSAWRLDEALRRHPGLSIAPDDDDGLTLTGTLAFSAAAPGREMLSDQYRISIVIPGSFPGTIPRVHDLGQRIPSSYHRLTDGSFCLGSPARLRLLLAGAPTIAGFIDTCVIPYLYGYSYFEKHGHLPFGELAHGHRGILDDYRALLLMPSIEACAMMLSLIGQKRRLANKRICPCGSGLRLGRCHNRRANLVRIKLGRRWCRAEANWLFEEYVSRSREARTQVKDVESIARGLRKEPERPDAAAPPTSEAAIEEKAMAYMQL